MTSQQRSILFVGGGTGGHLQPALVLRDALRTKHPSWSLKMLLSGRGVERKFLQGKQPHNRSM